MGYFLRLLSTVITLGLLMISLPSTALAATASASGCQDVSKVVTVWRGEATTADFSLGGEALSTGSMWVDSITFIPNGTSLLIKVKVVNPEPVAAAQMVLRLDYEGTNVRNTWSRTNTAGEAIYYWWLASEGSYVAEITMLTHNDYTWDKSQGVISAEYTVGQPTGNISGTVSDAESGAPVRGAIVTDGTKSATTDYNGEYFIADVPEGACSLTASKNGYQDAFQIVAVVADENVTANFALMPSVNRPPVLDPIGDKSVYEGSLLQFTVSASDPDGDSLLFSATNLPQGATFDNTQTFSWTPQYGQAGTYSDVHFEVSDGNSVVSEDITILVNKVPLTGGISGTVSDAESGVSIRGAVVTDGTRSATTDYNGKYSIANVPEGSYTITASASGYRNVSKVVTVWRGETTTADFSLSGAVIDSLEYDRDNGYYNAPVHVSGDIYAVAYKGPGTHGWLKTFEIASNGEIGTVIDTLEFESGIIGEWVDVVHIAGTTCAIVWQGNGRGLIGTVNIQNDGQIGANLIDSWEFDPVYGRDPRIVHISGTVHAIAYCDSANHGQIKTLDIAGNGIITKAWIDTLEYDSVHSTANAIVHVTESIYAIAYTGCDSDGWVVTVDIGDDGIIADAVVDSLEFDALYCQYPEIINTTGKIYAIAYLRGGVRVGTLSIDNVGSIDIIDTSLVVAGTLRFPDIIWVGSGTAAIVYNTAGRGADGILATVPIDNAGSIGALHDSQVFDDYCQDFSEIIHVAGDIFCICYEGSSGDGYATTIEINAITLDGENG